MLSRSNIYLGFISLSSVLMVVSLYMSLIWAPTEITLGDSQRIFYIHIPLAWLGMLSVIILAVFSIAYLITRNIKWDNLAYSTAELGFILITLVLVTGMIWSKAEWTVWWTWDPKLTTTVILWFIYLSYIMLRTYGPSDLRGASYGAVLGIIGAIDVPMIYMAANWWSSAHPELNIGPLSNESSSVNSEMMMTLLVSLIAYTMLYIIILNEKYVVQKGTNVIDEIYKKIF
ncbi:MAG: cytochrome C assembly protein [SAR202 cluster bacterium]|nr:cytochrome C assembly protein [SAR202 cluster bacterium]